MASAELELQGAIVAKVKTDPPLGALISGRIYDRVPEGADFPYITVGETQSIRDDATCVDGAQIYLTMHAWSRKAGLPEVKRVADALVVALHLVPLALQTNRLISLMHRRTRAFGDPDGLTSHAVIEFVANIEKP